MNESIQGLLAKRDYAAAIPLLEEEVRKYSTNYRLKLQLADALAGVGRTSEALERYDEIARHYDSAGLIVQAIGVRKKAEKIEADATAAADAAAAEKPSPRKPPESPLFENLTPDELKAVIARMHLEQFAEGDIVITEGESGCSLYVIMGGEVKVFTRGKNGESVLLATLGSGDFFGEISILTGRPRTATITASTATDLLRLDKEDLDELTSTMPRIREVLESFYQKRATQTVEAMIESMKGAR